MYEPSDNIYESFERVLDPELENQIHDIYDFIFKSGVSKPMKMLRNIDLNYYINLAHDISFDIKRISKIHESDQYNEAINTLYSLITKELDSIMNFIKDDIVDSELVLFNKINSQCKEKLNELKWAIFFYLFNLVIRTFYNIDEQYHKNNIYLLVNQVMKPFLKFTKCSNIFSSFHIANSIDSINLCTNILRLNLCMKSETIIKIYNCLIRNEKLIDFNSAHPIEKVQEKLRKNSNELDELEENECCICMEYITDIKVTLKCEHFYCKKCIDKWLHKSQNCPMCRKAIDIISQTEVKKKYILPAYQTKNIFGTSFIDQYIKTHDHNTTEYNTTKYNSAKSSNNNIGFLRSQVAKSNGSNSVLCDTHYQSYFYLGTNASNLIEKSCRQHKSKYIPHSIDTTNIYYTPSNHTVKDNSVSESAFRQTIDIKSKNDRCIAM
jgi:hypothetical protein